MKDDSLSRNASREFLFNYRFASADWNVTVFARDPAEAKEKVRAIALARYEGESAAKIPAAVPGAGLLVRLFCWWRGARTTAADTEIKRLRKERDIFERIAAETWAKQTEIEQLRAALRACLDVFPSDPSPEQFSRLKGAVDLAAAALSESSPGSISNYVSDNVFDGVRPVSDECLAVLRSNYHKNEPLRTAVTPRDRGG